MIIAINAKGDLELREPNDFKGFKILVEKQDADIASALKGVATLDGENAWVSQDALKNWKGQPQSPDWIASFDKMVDAVKKFGWIRESDGAVRAHIEKAGEAMALTLQQLDDMKAIERVYCLYCDVIDEKDFDRLNEVFTEDAYQDYRQTLGPDGIRRGTAELIAGAKTHMGKDSYCGATHHNVVNFRIDVSGDTATAKVHYYAVHRGQGKHEGALYSMWGEYDDKLVRTAKGWRVNHRMYRSFLTEGPVVTFKDD